MAHDCNDFKSIIQISKTQKEMKKYFQTRKIIYSETYTPAELVRYHKFKGKAYVRIAFTNKVKVPGFWPVTDIPVDQITGIRILPSPFKKWIFKLVGKTAKPRFIVIKKSNSK